MELGSLDVIKILGYGLSGFAFLLVFLAFMLLRKEQDKPEPRKLIIQTIQLFMGLCLILSIVVGLISIPIINSNNKKEEAIAKLQSDIKVNRISDSSAAPITALNDKLAMNEKLDSTQIKEAAEMVNSNLDKITGELKENQPENTKALEKVESAKAAVSKDFRKISVPNQNKDTVKVALARIRINTSSVKLYTGMLQPLEPATGK